MVIARRRQKEIRTASAHSLASQIAAESERFAGQVLHSSEVTQNRSGPCFGRPCLGMDPSHKDLGMDLFVTGCGDSASPYQIPGLNMR
mmetsp:Transcript_22380/g.40316  ORF Transcript_22380/g.40316 Transcript_22380/m.40316 type:complete len:88 (+) Transcript_22380:395-658(+)